MTQRRFSRSGLRPSRAAIWLVALCLIALSGCPATTSRQQKTKKAGRYGLVDGTNCRQFVDDRAGLSFCVPKGALLKRTKRFSSTSHGSFEARIALPGREAALWLRRDPLPEDIPEGALSGPWLLRYTEGYAQHRGAKQSQLQRKLLPSAWAKYVKADAATWAAFPLSGDNKYDWEEVMILARYKPATRVVISLRFSNGERQKRQALFRLLVLFVKHLRLQ